MSIAPPCHTRRESTTDSWITPKSIIDDLGPFDLDPCACIPQPWPCAKKSFTEIDDGLMQKWEGFVWCNPPYGKLTDAWLNRMALHNNGIALVFARTETRSFFRNVWGKASSIVFVEGRITFHQPCGKRSRSGGNSGGPSVLIGYGSLADHRLFASTLGQFVKLVR